ncbi:MmgE/PrpD family protein [Bradyrhizobium sp. CCBAU 51753]|uniref:MmgE/PrpD family protein n=1 Tax=Bradyrhizobium sp. CCBAU 51753 TaxID=1325100 RepID=UPI00188CA292|nr:MmgE/PrpD family protein [Bradyrhizobium sp. CCBAU 51753]QOZ23919.1 hypothetical protein XH93_10060 [Bradyrhizobium sp. CCBAU 51753]
MQMVEITAPLAKFVSELTLERVPDSIKHEARRFILDTLGCTIAGARSEIGPVVLSTAKLFGKSKDATIAGGGKRFTSPAASYGNGRLANCLDLDETYPGGPIAGLHFGASVFGEALASCEQMNLTSKELILAATCGYEVAGRISDIGTQIEIEGGRITSMPEVWGISLAPTVGASAAAGRLLNQSAAALEQTFGVAASNAATPIGPIWSRQIALPNTKYYDSGWAAMAGGFAAKSVERGSTGLASIFDGTSSIFKMVGARRIEPNGIVGELGSRWAFENIGYKPWPSCRWHHYALCALNKVRKAGHFNIDEIEEIVVGVNTAALSDRFLNPEPPNFVARQFSFAHAIAMFLLDVPPGPEWTLERWASDWRARDLRSKVKIVDNPRAATYAQYFVRGQFRQVPTFAEVRFRGKTVQAEVDFAWGDPWSDETRFSDDDIVEKFRSVTNLPSSIADPVIETVMVAELGASLSPVCAALSYDVV